MEITIPVPLFSAAPGLPLPSPARDGTPIT